MITRFFGNHPFKLLNLFNILIEKRAKTKAQVIRGFEGLG